MKRFCLLGFLLLVAPLSFARSVEVCPTLPADSGLEWTYNDGPDFDVCLAHAPGSDDLAFGVYLGMHPDFHPERSARIGSGKVAGHRVTWYPPDPEDSLPPLSRQTLVKLGRGYVAHIWIAADSDQALADRLSVLERIGFRTK